MYRPQNKNIYCKSLPKSICIYQYWNHLKQTEIWQAKEWNWRCCLWEEKERKQGLWNRETCSGNKDVKSKTKQKKKKGKFWSNLCCKWNCHTYKGTMEQGTQLHTHTFDPFWPLMPHTVMGKTCSSMNTDLFCDYCEFHHPSWPDWREWEEKEIRTTESERKMEWKYQFWHHFNHMEQEIKGGSINRNRWE